MKTPVSPHMVVALVFSTIATLSAQNTASTPPSPEFSKNAESVIQAEASVSNADPLQSHLLGEKPAYSIQGNLPLDRQSSNRRDVSFAVNEKALLAAGAGAKRYKIDADSLQTGLSQMATIYRESGKQAETTDCAAVSHSVEQRIQSDISKVLEIVESEVGANPSCACEIVKSAITASGADVARVVAIVETAITAAPDSMRIISQCAIATMPESIAEVQALLAELDPNSGDAGYSSKSAKSAKGGKDAEVASIIAPETPNPLDRFDFTPFVPPVIIPSLVTNVNPGGL